MIQVQNLHKHFGSTTALQGLSFEAPDGMITGLLGSNGAGKTTTLRMICGVLQPDAGWVRIDDATSLRSRVGLQRRVGGLLDHTGLYSRLTVRENLTYFGELQGLAPARLKERVDELIALLGLGPIADRRTHGMSQGQRMKTALGRAMIHSPKNLVLDEPTNGLDVPSVRSLRVILERMRDAGICVLFSSHVLEEVRALCGKVVVISQGAAVAEGPPDEICRQAGGGSLEDAFVALTEAPAC